MKVFVADDHAVVRLGVKHVLQELGGFTVVGEASDGRQVLNSPALATADVLVLDLSLPRVDGSEVLHRVRERWPQLAIVVLSMHPEDQFARRALAAGASAYLSKDRPPADLIAAVRRAAAGQRDASPVSSPADAPRAAHEQLTRREHQIFMLLVRGRSVLDIAAELNVHSCTVSNHLANVRSKLGASTVADLVRYAYAAGLVESAPGGALAAGASAGEAPGGGRGTESG